MATDKDNSKASEVLVCKGGYKDGAREQNEFTLSAYEMRKMRFSAAKNLAEAERQVWGGEFPFHPYYQHYTTLQTLVGRILQGEWWMTRSDNVGLNDVQEARKFGSRELLRRTYQISFSHGTAESAAMWALYSQQDPFAVRVLLPGKVLKGWVDKIVLAPGKKTNGLEIDGRPEFKDLIYAAVPFSNAERDALDKNRGNVIYWSEASCDFGKDKSVQSRLAHELRFPELTGWVKDYEWRHERESRICLRLKKISSRKAIPIFLPPEVIAEMSFTLSPWLSKGQEKVVKSIIEKVLTINREILEGKLIRKSDDKDDKSAVKVKPKKNHFHRSVLENAMNFKKEY